MTTETSLVAAPDIESMRAAVKQHDDAQNAQNEKFQAFIDAKVQESVKQFALGLRPDNPLAVATTSAPAHVKSLGDDPIKAIAAYIRTGQPQASLKRVSAEEIKAYNAVDMVEGTPAAGGYVVPVGMYNEVIAKRDETSLIPKLGLREIPGKGLTVNVPVDNEADVIFTAVNELAAIGKDSPALGQAPMTLVKYSKYYTLSWELIRDEDAKLLTFLTDWIGRGVAATTNNAIIAEAAANGTAAVTLPSTLTSDALQTLTGALMPEYQDSANFVMHPTTYANVSKLTGNPFLYINTPAGAFPAPSINGFPVYRSSWAAVPAASAKTMIFANWNFVGYRMTTDLVLINDPYTLAGNGQVKITAWFDFVAKVLQAEAVQVGTQST